MLNRFRTRVVIKAISPFLPTLIELIPVMLPGSAREKGREKGKVVDTKLIYRHSDTRIDRYTDQVRSFAAPY